MTSGYQGVCYDCGEKGHKRGEGKCPGEGRRVNEVGDDEDAQVGGAVNQSADEGAVEAELPTLDMGSAVIHKPIELSKDRFAQMRELEEEIEECPEGIVEIIDICPIGVPGVPVNDEGLKRVPCKRKGAASEKIRYAGSMGVCGRKKCEDAGCCRVSQAVEVPQEVEICIGEADPKKVSRFGFTFQVTG